MSNIIVAVFLRTFMLNALVSAFMRPIVQKNIQGGLKLLDIKICSTLSRTNLLGSLDSAYIRSNQEDKIVLDDFEQILESIKIFKKVFGDLDIPSKFEVPSESPWPSNLFGLRLGRRLEKILSCNEFFERHGDKVYALQSLGFNATINSLVDDWTLIYKSLLTYKSLNGDLRISSKFIVPDCEPWHRLARNMKLGVKVAAIRSAGRFVKGRPERKSDLDNIGFEWRVRDHTHRQQVEELSFQQIIEALTYYQANEGSVTLIPENFVIPDEPSWPVTLRGIKLGQILQNILSEDKFIFGHEDRVSKLVELGFNLDKKTSGSVSDKRFETVYAALEEYKNQKNNLLVPINFVVPSEEPWPTSAWGLKLGQRVNAIRSQGTFVVSSPERRSLLNALGFVWDTTGETSESATAKSRIETSKIDSLPDQPGEIIDKSSVANQLSPHKFDEGNNMMVTRVSGIPRSVFSFDPTYMFENINYREMAAETILEYRRSRDYSDDPLIRDIAHFEGKMTPSDICTALSRMVDDDGLSILRTKGYRIFEFGEFSWDDVVKSLQIFKQIYGHVNAPIDFVVKETMDGFSGHGLHGLPLGEVINIIRIGDADGYEDTNRRNILDSLGFSWGELSKYQRFRFVPMFYGLRIYRHIHGFPLPPEDFIVPDEPAWPTWMVNMPLGMWTTIARIQQKIISEHYPKRRDMLDALDFIWTLYPTENFPKKYFEELK